MKEGTPKKPRILMIVTSNASMGDTGKPTGLWAEELAVPYYALVDAGAEVTLASPAGGPAPIDPGSGKAKGANDAVGERFLADAALQACIAATPKAADFDGAKFDALFFPGGHGTMWDLPVDAGVSRAVERAFAASKLIASVCHGAAGLVTAKRPDGQSIVKDLRVNSFTDAEEVAVGLEKIVPFMLETRLRELGGKFEGAANWKPFATRDGQLITGQNPQSSHLVAQALLEALGVTAKA
jgi:putative intracellular protease/amidase